MTAVQEHPIVGADLPPEFLKEAEKVYGTRAISALHSLKWIYEAWMKQGFNPELSGKLDGCQVVIEALGVVKE